MGSLTLILGGAKSGKTAAALSRCAAYPSPRVYLATAENRDSEMALRIARHQAERGPEWRTLEEPYDPIRALKGLETEDVGVVLLDCLTLWLSNLLAGRGLEVESILALVEDLAEASLKARAPVVVVSNEVGWGVVPDNKLARDFRDLSGAAHQLLAARADEVLLIAAGLPLKLK